MARLRGQGLGQIPAGSGASCESSLCHGEKLLFSENEYLCQAIHFQIFKLSLQEIGRKIIHLIQTKPSSGISLQLKDDISIKWAFFWVHPVLC